MMGENRRTIERYIRKIGKELQESPAKKWAIKAELREILYDTYGTSEHLTEEMLYEEFGLPEEVAMGYYEKTDVSKLKKRTGKYTVIAAGVCVLAVLAVAFTVYLIVKTKETVTIVSNFGAIWGRRIWGMKK